MKKIFLVLLCCFFQLRLMAALPPKAQAYLQQIPGQQLTLAFVIKTALENAESYRVLGYQYATAELEEMGQIDSITDTFFNASADYADDNSAKTNGFQALRAKQWRYNLGLTKNWSTGTMTYLGWEYDTNELEFANLGNIGGLFVTDYKQSAAVLKIEQNLLRDNFGSSFRNKRRGARLNGEAIQWKTRKDLESLTMQFVLQYYNAWLTKQQVLSNQSQVARQAKLVKILTRRSRKGAVEKPDLIQGEALLASSRARLDLAKTELRKQWETLVFSLKLPNDFLEVDPMDIPIQIDNPVPLGLRVCGLKEPKKTAQIASLEKNLSALDANFKAAKNDSLPDLKLVAGYRGNSIDQSAATTVENVLAGSDTNGFGRGPAWNLGLKLVWPLNNSQARAARTKNYIEKEQTAARLRVAVDDLKVQWRDSCRRLKVEANNEKTFKNLVKEQKKECVLKTKDFL